MFEKLMLLTKLRRRKFYLNRHRQEMIKTAAELPKKWSRNSSWRPQPSTMRAKNRCCNIGYDQFQSSTPLLLRSQAAVIQHVTHWVFQRNHLNNAHHRKGSLTQSKQTPCTHLKNVIQSPNPVSKHLPHNRCVRKPSCFSYMSWTNLRISQV